MSQSVPNLWPLLARPETGFQDGNSIAKIGARCPTPRANFHHLRDAFWLQLFSVILEAMEKPENINKSVFL